MMDVFWEFTVFWNWIWFWIEIRVFLMDIGIFCVKIRVI